MERHRCKVCHRRFATGQSLGGHMRTHVIAPPPPVPGPANSAASSSSFSAPEEKEKMTGYALRENPRKSCRLVGSSPSASFVALNSSSVVQEGAESDVESSRRPKRLRESTDLGAGDGEPLSCVTDASPDEDVARCLMLLSRDSWTKTSSSDDFDDIDIDYGDGDDDDDDEEIMEFGLPRRRRTRYECSNCCKVFRSYQALGGHRASHKRVGIQCVPPTVSVTGIGIRERVSFCEEKGSGNGKAKKVYECPYCDRVFSSGQALGGHKRSHFTGSGAGASARIAVTNDGGIDLNLPASLDEEPELSAMSFTTEFAFK